MALAFGLAWSAQVHEVVELLDPVIAQIGEHDREAAMKLDALVACWCQLGDATWELASERLSRHAGRMVTRAREGTSVRYALAGDQALALWLALRDASFSQLAEFERAARDYLGDDVDAIGRDELLARLRKGDVVLVDVRPTEEFDAGHIKGARSIPIAEPEDRLAELPADGEVVAYCRGPFCAYAHDAVRQLELFRAMPRARRHRPPRDEALRRADARADRREHEESRPMTTAARQLDTTELKQRVQRMYEEVALEPEREFHFETGRPLAERLGYPPADLDRIPAAAIDAFAGVGYFLDLAVIALGETVLDLGATSRRRPPMTPASTA
ncbi:MAG: rhodanese-like domain-containing protein [Solirubrobacteraceae bacterium]